LTHGIWIMCIERKLNSHGNKWGPIKP
jgi:hypothetical protein